MLKIFDLRCEYKKNPVGIDVHKPRFFWKLSSDDRGAMQSAYQINVASSDQDLNGGSSLIWDSGMVKGDSSIQVEYAGPVLNSGERLFWRVRVWDEKGIASEWSETAFWEMGLLNGKDWKAKLIQPDISENPDKSEPCPMLRKEFRLKDDVISARLYITAHGLYEAWINGKRVGDEYFTPGWTTYSKCLQYQTYDVTDQVRHGDNAIGVYLGDGWFRGFISYIYARNVYGKKLALYSQLEVTYQDGSTDTIVSDGTWKSSTGPILESDMFNGETYKASLEKAGWDNAGFDDSNWGGVTEKGLDKSILMASPGVAVKKIEEIRPLKVIKTPKGETVFDFGQNMVGWVRLNVSGAKGTAVTLMYGEVLDSDGNFYNKNLRLAKATDVYILKGENKQELYEPRFTFHGFRYVRIEGFPAEATLDSLTGIVLHSDMEKTGNFSCSNSLVNKLFQNIVWSQKGNFLDVPTDCPQRDERMGWSGDLQVFAPTACFNMDTPAFLTRWLRDLRHDQWKNGIVPIVVPDSFTDRIGTFRQVIVNAVRPRKGAEKGFFDEYFAIFRLNSSAGWGDAAVIVPWNMYLYFGDRRILEAQYESMKSFLEFKRKEARRLFDVILFNPAKWFRLSTWRHKRYYSTGRFGFGDWLAPGDGMNGSILRSKLFIPAIYLAIDTLILAKSAAILGREKDSKDYYALYEKVKESITYFRLKKEGRMWPHRQTTYVLSLAADILPDEDKPKAAKILADMVEENGYRIGTGFLGTPHICHVLSSYGYAEHAYRLLLNENHQWLSHVKKGATTIWEHWDAVREDGSFVSERMLSFNHYAFGAIGDWLYRAVAGINLDELNPGFRHIVIKPVPGGGLTHAKASYNSIYGLVSSEWVIADSTFSLKVEIPANTTATVIIPEKYHSKISEAAHSVTLRDGSVDIGSGRYEFLCKGTLES
jgi:alpha-L-rhamnosidase